MVIFWKKLNKNMYFLYKDFVGHTQNRTSNSYMNNTEQLSQ